MKINGLIKKARWESISCGCGKEVMDSFPIKDCLHCKFDQCWKSVPQTNFKVNEPEMKNDKPTGKIITREIKEITLVRGSKYQDVIGWNF
jgi:hypothetical protein